MYIMHKNELKKYFISYDKERKYYMVCSGD